MAVFKPPVPIINWGNPLTRGLVMDVPMFEKAGVGVKDIINNRKSGFTNSPTWVTKNAGVGVGFTGSDSDAITFTNNPSALNNITTVTVETMAIMDSSPGNGIRIFHKGSASRRYFQNLEHDAGEMYCAADWTSGGNQGAWRFSASNITTGRPFHHIVTYDSASTSNDPVVYLNGKTMSLQEVVSPSGSRATDDTNLNIGNSFAGTHSWKGTIFYVRMWNRCITSTEARSLYVNPWQIYKDPYIYQQRANSIIDVITSTYAPQRLTMGIGI